MKLHKIHKTIIFVIITIFGLSTNSFGDENINALTKLSLEEVLDLEVSTLSKKERKFFNTPAAIHVITSEEIRRSGVRSVVEILRTVPGLQVSRINSNQWTVTIRGFSFDRFANKLLVLVDGRSVYSQLFSGVLWEEIDTILDDIERIEVIRGPGGTAWGTNAVNGIINIITKDTADTYGLFVKAGGGNEEQGFIDLRYGGVITENWDYRIFGKFFNRDSFTSVDGGDSEDQWNSYRFGFKTELDLSKTGFFSLQGEVFSIDYDQTLSLPSPTSPPNFTELAHTNGDSFGVNLVAKYERDFSNNSNTKLQFFYDYLDREIDFIAREKRNTFDIDFQNQFAFNDFFIKDFIWGLGFRITSDDLN